MVEVRDFNGQKYSSVEFTERQAQHCGLASSIKSSPPIMSTCPILGKVWSEDLERVRGPDPLISFCSYWWIFLEGLVKKPVNSAS